MTDERTAVRVDVREVTLLEDRALVRRRGNVAVVPGRNRLRVEGVSPIVVDKTLLGEVDSKAARLVDLRIRRARAPVGSVGTDDVKVLDEEVRGARRALVVLEDRHRALRSRLDALGRLVAGTAHDMATDAAWGRTIDAERRSAFERLVEQDAQARVDGAELARQIETEREALARKVKRRSLLDHPSTTRIASLELDVEATEAGEVEIAISYVVPNACWRPRHRAVLDDGSVSFQTEAVAWQNTGEAWDGVALSFSTERPSLGTAPPSLEADVLTAVRKGALVVETRQEEVERAGLGAAPRKKVVHELPGIDDGGEALCLRAAHDVSIATDGRPHGVPLSTFVAPAVVEMVAMPELVAAVLVKATFENAGGRPLLPGPVELVRGGGPVGRTTIGFIAAKEKLELGFGPDGAVRIHREVEQLKDETSMLSSWTTKAHDVKLRLSNLSAHPKSILVRERVTISEIEKIQVTVVANETTGAKQADEHGFVSWRVELPPLGRSELKLRVSTRRHSDVIGG